MEVKIGTVTHFYTRLSVAIIELTDELNIGDSIHIKGHTSDFTQTVESMQVEHEGVTSAKAGDAIGLMVSEHAREGDEVFKVIA